MIVTFSDVKAAARRIADSVIETPTVHSPKLSDMLATHIRLKLENLQYTASFKERGALNCLLGLGEAERAAGVIAMSAGNHAQAVARHAQELGIEATIVMPKNTPFQKVANTEALGAAVVLEGNDLAEAAVFADTEARARGLTLVHPYEDPRVIAGQGTVALEMLEAAPDLDTLVVPVGGGGLIAGCILAAREINPEIVIVGVQAARCPAMLAALGGTEPEARTDTLAEGIAVKRPGQATRDIIAASGTEIVLVDEGEIESAIMLLAEVEKLVVEGAGAASLAAILAHPRRFTGRRIGAVVSGGNIDPRLLAGVLMRGLVRLGRLVRLRVEIDDLPGKLAQLTRAVGRLGGDIVEVEHQRWFHDVPARKTLVDLLVEVRSPEEAGLLVDGLTAEGYEVSRLGSTSEMR